MPRRLEPWPDEPGPALAAVNSFGFGGANAHVVLAAAPDDAPGDATGPEPAAGRAEILPLSARSPEALAALATALRDAPAAGGEPPGTAPAPLGDLAWTAGVRRDHHEHRLAVVAHGHEELRSRLGAFLEHREAPGVRQGQAARGRRLAWVFSGMGPQWWAMGRELLDEEPVFREVIKSCDRLMRRHAEWSLLAEMRAAEDDSNMRETWISQPASFALQAGLAALLRSWGVAPDAIVGHSTGEAAAHWAAGVVDLDEAVRIIVHRSRLQQRTAGQGKLVAVGLPLEEARELIAGRDGISIAAVNSPASVALSGDAAALEQAVAPLAERGVFCRFLRVEVPFHSPLMDPIRADLLASLEALDLHPAEVALYSTVTTERAAGPELDAGYWWRNVREPVYFAATVDRMIEDGYDTFLEIGAHPVLTGSIDDCLRRRDADGTVVATLRRETEERASLLDALGGLYTAGFPVDWQALHPAPRRVAPLPLYPWQRERHWEESAESARARLEPAVHPLLGKARDTARPEWRAKLARSSTPYLRDHQVHGGVVFPAAGYVEMGVAAIREAIGEDAALEIEDIRFDHAMFLPAGETRQVQTTFDPTSLLFEVHSRSLAAERWERHAHGRLLRARRAPRPAAVADLDALRAGFDQKRTSEACYAALAERGFHYGPAFRGLESVEAGPDALLAALRVPDPALVGADGLAVHHVHPVLLDAGLQALLLHALLVRPTTATYLPVAIGRLVVHGRSRGGGRALCRLRSLAPEEMVGDVSVYDEAGRPILELERVRVAALEAAGDAGEPLDRMLSEIAWQPLAAPDEDPETEPDAGAPAATWLLFADRAGTARRLAAALEAAGERAVAIERGAGYELDAATGLGRLDPRQPEHLRRLLADLAGRVAAGDLPPCRALVHLWSLDAPGNDRLDAEALLRAQEDGPIALLHTLQALGEATWREPPRLWIVTRGGQRVGEEDVAVAQAPVWGFARTAFHQEHSDLAGGIVDLDPAAGDAEADDESARLLEVFRRDGDEDQLALRGAATMVPRMVPAPALAAGFLTPRVRPDGSYLVTGGLGGLGLLYARWLVERGARRLVLVARTPLPARAEWLGVSDVRTAGQIAGVRALEALGAGVRTASLDVADGEALDALLAELHRDGWGPVRGVLHAAGVSSPKLMIELEAGELLATLRPKLAGAWLLHDRLREEPLDFFVLFASVAGLGFSMGMADYAAGNAFLDGLAGHRRAHGLAANSVDWGPWGEVGMASAEAVANAFVERGFVLIRPGQGAEVMDRVFEHDPAQLVVLGADWSVATRRNYPTGPPALLRAFEQEPADGEAAATEALTGWRERLVAAAPDEREALLTDHLRESAARVLRLDPEDLAPNDSLGDLGLDSMLAVELRNRVETSLGAGPSIVELLQGASPADLAGILLPRLALERAEEEAEPGEADDGVQADDDAGPIPLSHGQRALWFLYQREPESPAYNVAFAGRITSEVDVPALRRAVQGWVDRHPALRTRYMVADGSPVQQVEPERQVAFTPVDAASLSDEGLRRRVDAAYREPFDLVSGSLLRVHLFTCGERDHVFLLTAHHIAVDGWSLFLLLEELRALYPAACSGAEPTLPPPAATYADHVRRQCSLLDGAEGERLWRYWQRKLDPPPAPLEIPTDRPRPKLQTMRGASHTFEVDAETTQGLRQVAARQGATLFMALVAVLQALLYRITGQQDVAVGSTAAGRATADLSDVVGHFVNSLVLRADLSDRPTFRTLLGRTRDTALGAFAHQDFPFPLLVERLQTAWDPSRAPLFQVSLVLQNLPGLGSMPELLADAPGAERATDLGGLRVEPYPLDQQAGQHELEFEIYERSTSLLVVLQYNSDLFDPGTIEILARRFTRLAASAAAHPESRVEELEMLSEAERQEKVATVARRREQDQERLRASRRQGVRLAAADEDDRRAEP